MVKKTGKYLRELRIMNGLTQKEAAEIFSTNRGTYSSWESRYKKKILPKKVLSNYAIKMLILNHPAISKENKKEIKKGLLEGIKKWIVQLVNLLK